MKKQKRYQTLRNHPGIQKDLLYGGYLVTKSFKRKRYTKYFKKLSDAIQWKNSFNPDLVLLSKKSCETFEEENGQDLGYKLNDVWKMYLELHLSSMSHSTQEVAIEIANNFFDGLWQTRMCDFVPSLIDKHISKKREVALLQKTRRRSFSEDLKRLSAVLNWYKENFDFKFINPILKRHKVLGTIAKSEPKNKKLNPEQLKSFFSNLEDIWKDVAIMQFFMAGRVSEVAGLQWDMVKLADRSIEVRRAAYWSRKSKEFLGLKLTKNGEARFCHINERMFEILEKRSKLSKNSPFVFTFEDQPLKYRQIQYRYNKALKSAKLYPDFSATHIMRHSMATITRKVTGSLQATQAVTGHKDQRLVEHYASLPSNAQIEAVQQVESYLKLI